MRRTAVFLAAAVLATTAACGGSASCEASGTCDESRPLASVPVVPIGTATTDLAKADAAFGMALLARLTSKPGNVAISPYSIATALQMTLQGARDQTATEMLRVLRLANAQAAAKGLATLTKSLGAITYKDGPTLRIANTVWVQSGLPIEPAFDSTVKGAFAAAFHDADFRTKWDDARAAINDLIAKQTRDKIRGLLPEGVITSLTRLVLANAIYLKAQWVDQFAKAETRDGPFHLASGATVQLPRMHQEKALTHMRGKGYQAVQLPLDGGRLAMTVLLPDRSVEQLIPQLLRDGLASVQARLLPTQVDLTLPRFRMTTAFALGEVLAAMGMPTPFTDAADFSGITKAERLAISFVQHKAFVNVDEEGTEAAAATAVGVGVVSGPITPPRKATVVVDRPFLFAITDTQTGTPLFLGRVADPREK